MFFFFFSLSLAFVFVILVLFFELLSLLLSRFLLPFYCCTQYFFAFARFYFIQKLVLPMSLLQSCVASVFKHYIPRCSYTYPECISFVVFSPSTSPSSLSNVRPCLCLSFFFFFLLEFSGWPLHIHLSCPLLTLCPVIQSKEKVPFFVQFWWLSFQSRHVPTTTCRLLALGCLLDHFTD